MSAQVGGCVPRRGRCLPRGVFFKLVWSYMCIDGIDFSNFVPTTFRFYFCTFHLLSFVSVTFSEFVCPTSCVVYLSIAFGLISYIKKKWLLLSDGCGYYMVLFVQVLPQLSRSAVRLFWSHHDRSLSPCLPLCLAALRRSALKNALAWIPRTPTSARSTALRYVSAYAPPICKRATTLFLQKLSPKHEKPDTQDSSSN